MYTFADSLCARRHSNFLALSLSLFLSLSCPLSAARQHRGVVVAAGLPTRRIEIYQLGNWREVRVNDRYQLSSCKLNLMVIEVSLNLKNTKYDLDKRNKK